MAAARVAAEGAHVFEGGAEVNNAFKVRFEAAKAEALRAAEAQVEAEPCTICLEPIADAAELPCAHRLCKPCLDQHVASVRAIGSEADRPLVVGEPPPVAGCPVCRAPFCGTLLRPRHRRGTPAEGASHTPPLPALGRRPAPPRPVHTP